MKASFGRLVVSSVSALRLALLSMLQRVAPRRHDGRTHGRIITLLGHPVWANERSTRILVDVLMTEPVV
jgi:hypothetical protein